MGWTALIALLASLPVLRLLRDGIQSFGTDGAPWIEPLARLRLMEHLEQADGSWWERLVGADAAFPPGLHLLSLPWVAAVGEGPLRLAASGVFWLLVLAAAGGVVARRLGSDQRGAFVTVAVVAALPSLQGMASRYYYDLPMTALLWVSVAVVLALAPRRPLLAGLLGGGIALLACGVKWAAIPYGLPMLALGFGLAVSGARHALLCLLGLTLAVGISAGGSWGYLQAVGESNSFTMQRAILEMQDPILGPLLCDHVEVLPSPLTLALQRLGSWSPAELGFYPLRLISSVLSPLMTLLLVLGAGAALRARRARLLLLVLGVALAHGLFILGMIPVLDDRWLVVGVPALAIAGGAGLGLSARSPWLRFLLAALLLGVAVEFHFAPRAAFNSAWEAVASPGSRPHREDSSGEAIYQDRDQPKPRPAVVFRGPFGASSVEDRGWTRGDEQAPSRARQRAAALATVQACKLSCVGLGLEMPGLAPQGDFFWWQAVTLASFGAGSADAQPPPAFVSACPELGDGRPTPCELDGVLVPTAEREADELLGCAPVDGWAELRIRGDAADPDLVLLVRDPQPSCIAPASGD